MLLQLSLNLVFKIIKGNVLTLFISNKLLNNSLKIKKDSSIPKGDHKIIHNFFFLIELYISLLCDCNALYKPGESPCSDLLSWTWCFL